MYVIGKTKLQSISAFIDPKSTKIRIIYSESVLDSQMHFFFLLAYRSERRLPAETGRLPTWRLQKSESEQLLSSQRVQLRLSVFIPERPPLMLLRFHLAAKNCLCAETATTLSDALLKCLVYEVTFFGAVVNNAQTQYLTRSLQHTLETGLLHIVELKNNYE